MMTERDSIDSAPEFSGCPTAAELLARQEGHLDATTSTWVERHLLTCSPCRLVATNLKAAPARPMNVSFRLDDDILAAHRGRALRFAERNGQSRPPSLQVGQLWSTKLPSDDDAGTEEIDAVQRLVVIVDSIWTHRDLGPQVAPLLVDNSHRTDLDVAIGGQENPLGYDFDVQVWNSTPMLEEQLGRFLGQLDQRLTSLIGLVYHARLGEEVNLSAVRDRLGIAISGPADPRMVIQEDETAALAYLREPFRRRLAALGRVIDVDLEQDAVEVDTIGDLLRWGTADLADVVPVERLQPLWADRTPVDVLGDRERRRAPLLSALNGLGLTGSARDAFVERVLGLFGSLESVFSGGQQRLYARRQRGRGRGAS